MNEVYLWLTIMGFSIALLLILVVYLAAEMDRMRETIDNMDKVICEQEKIMMKYMHDKTMEGVKRGG